MSDIQQPDAELKKTTCGIVMPISENSSGSKNHWDEVREVLNEAIRSAGFEPNLVSTSDHTAVLQSNIVKNLANNEIVVCDVSGLNPNVMFELGIRLAFKKPVVIVKDELTKYPFDMSPILYEPYPNNLTHWAVIAFIKKLAARIKATHAKAMSPGQPSVLEELGAFTFPRFDTKEVSGFEFLSDKVDKLASLVYSLIPPISPIPKPPLVEPAFEFNPMQERANAMKEAYMRRLVGELATLMNFARSDIAYAKSNPFMAKITEVESAVASCSKNEPQIDAMISEAKRLAAD